MADINIDVESAEIDTEVSFFHSPYARRRVSYFHISKKEVYYTFFHVICLLFNLPSTFTFVNVQGLVAKDKFYVSYRGAALTSSLSQVTYCIQFSSGSGNHSRVSRLRYLFMVSNIRIFIQHFYLKLNIIHLPSFFHVANMSC